MKRNVTDKAINQRPIRRGKLATRRLWTWYPLSLVSICGAFLFISCSHLTVKPVPVVAHEVAMGETSKPDANILDCDGTGCLVRPQWVKDYHALEAKFKEPFEDQRIVPEGNFFRVPYILINHFADMKRRERLAEAGV